MKKFKLTKQRIYHEKKNFIPESSIISGSSLTLLVWFSFKVGCGWSFGILLLRFAVDLEGVEVVVGTVCVVVGRGWGLQLARAVSSISSSSSSSKSGWKKIQICDWVKNIKLVKTVNLSKFINCINKYEKKFKKALNLYEYKGIRQEEVQKHSYLQILKFIIVYNKWWSTIIHHESYKSVVKLIQ